MISPGVWMRGGVSCGRGILVKAMLLQPITKSNRGSRNLCIRICDFSEGISVQSFACWMGCATGCRPICRICGQMVHMNLYLVYMNRDLVVLGLLFVVFGLEFRV